ncbi:MAG: tRNA threonylcarbamoyladenosine biosynthesis protein TsaE [Gaiellales bacterium]|nr:tRNA threonylcarbamoyladenosine biosynthesis protein TsaE [Gaiellales bacterium]
MLRISSSSSELETAQLGAALARTLLPGAVVYVEGELGAGKTAFVRGAAHALGVRDQVTSPTFTVAHLYEGDHGPVAHLDLYRGSALGDEELADLEPYFEGVRATFIEWAARGGARVPAADVHVLLSIAGEDAREIEIKRD